MHNTRMEKPLPCPPDGQPSTATFGVEQTGMTRTDGALRCGSADQINVGTQIGTNDRKKRSLS